MQVLWAIIQTSIKFRFTYLMPGDKVLGWAFRKSRICRCVGWMIFRRSRRASWKVIDPFIASFVRRATSWPLPQNFANSSIPSSRITVESTSKHTMSELRIICAAADAFFDLSPINSAAFHEAMCINQSHAGKRFAKHICKEGENSVRTLFGYRGVVSLVWTNEWRQHFPLHNGRICAERIAKIPFIHSVPSHAPFRYAGISQQHNV